MRHFQSCIYITFLCYLEFHTFASNVNKAPAKVTIRLQVLKLKQTLINVSRLKICVDKITERCFWTWNEAISWDGDQYKEIPITFFMENMATDLFLEVQIEHANKKIDFPRKAVNLTKMGSKTLFELHSYDLESFISLTIEHECENGYYPPRQCTHACHPMPKEWDCDGFGNKICKKGLLLDKNVDRCIANNCPIRCVNGRCVNKASIFECECHESYAGKSCQFRNPCSPNPCYNGGLCNANINNQSFICSCPPQFTGSECLTKVNEKCLCPSNMRCNDLCVPQSQDSNDNMINTSEGTSPNKRISEVKSRESKRNHEWSQVSLTTTITAAVGCVMVIMCIIVSLCVCYHTREFKVVRRDSKNTKCPSTMYTDVSPQLTETSFKRSLSLDDNSAYIPSNSQMFQILPNNFIMGSSNEYSLHRNLCHESLPPSIRSFPIYEDIKFKREYPITPTTLYRSNTKGSSVSTASCSSLQTPPVIPPRPKNADTTPSGTLPKAL